MTVTAKPDIKAFFDEPTNTVSYLVWDAATREAVVIDPVLNFDHRSGEADVKAADAILAEAAGWSGPPRTDARWNEYDHLGDLARYGTPLPPDAGPRAVQPLLDRALRAWIDEDGTGEDGWKAFATGATTALDELVAGLGAGRDAVVVTSGGVLAAICGALLRTGADGVVALHRVAVNAAITTVVAGGSGTSLLAFNGHAHFTGDRRQLLTYRLRGA